MSGNLTIALNADNDIYIDDTGNLAFLTGIDALQQDCVTTCEAQLNEMIFDFNSGMPTMLDVFTSINLQQYVTAGRQRLLAVPGVTQVISFVANQSADQLQYSAQIKTIYSNQPVTITNVRSITL